MLTSKVNDEEIIVLDKLELDAISTKAAQEVISKINIGRNALFVVSERDEKVYRSFKNIPNVDTVVADKMNVYDILKYDSFVVTQDAVKKIEEVYA